MQVKSYVSRLIDPRKIRRKKHRDDQEIDEQRNGSHCKRGEESRQHLYVHVRLSGNARAYLHVITTQTLKETRPRSSQHCKQGQCIEKHRRRQWRVRAHNNPVTEAAFTCLTEIIFGLHANAVTKRKKVVALFSKFAHGSSAAAIATATAIKRARIKAGRLIVFDSSYLASFWFIRPPPPSDPESRKGAISNNYAGSLWKCPTQSGLHTPITVP